MYSSVSGRRWKQAMPSLAGKYWWRSSSRNTTPTSSRPVSNERPRDNRGCFGARVCVACHAAKPALLGRRLYSALLYLVIFAEVKLYMEAGLQIVYAAMAVVGWIFWGKDKTADTLPVTNRPGSFTRRRYSASLSGLGYRDLCSAPTRTQQDPLSMREQPSQQSFAPGWSPEKYSKTGFIGLLSTRFQSGYLLIGVSP